MVKVKSTGGGKRVMENTRSYVSRFSGLGLFLLALLVVGVLVWLTIRSANDSNNEVVTETSTEQNDTAGSLLDSEDTVTNEDRDDAGATIQDGQPDSGNDVAGETNTNGNLPNTGPESVLLGTLGLAAMTGVAMAYRRSVNELRQAQL